jgi:AraC family transcriptional regulator
MKALQLSEPSFEFMTTGGRRPFFDAPTLRSSDHPWAGYGFEESPSPLEPLPSHSWAKTTLLHICPFEGQSSLRWKHRGSWNNDIIQTGTVSIVRRDIEIQAAIAASNFPVMVLQLDNSQLHHLAPSQVTSIDEALVAVQVTRDPQLAGLMTAMRAEVREGCPSGRLFAESISIALLAYLANRYTNKLRSVGGAGSLSASQKKTVASYVRSNLSDNISITELASLADLSPSRFTRAFKSAFGDTPYRYVMRQRIEAAKLMLREKALTATAVAMSLGFSSQSHFIKVFRQFTGLTPSQFRNDAD